MVEMAIVLPLLIILLFSIIQMGIALNRVQAYHAAAREGARIGSLQNVGSGEITAAATGALDGLQGPTPSVAITPCTGLGSSITVIVSGPYTVQIPLLPNYNVTLTGNGTFRCEG